MNPKKIVEKFKAAGVSDDPPSSLVVLLRRCITSKFSKYKHYHGVAEPHLFTYPASTRLSIMGPDLKKLLMGGLTRIQCNEPNEVTFYFGPTREDEERIRILDTLDFRQMGEEAFAAGKMRAPAQDVSLMKALQAMSGGLGTSSGPIRAAMEEWLRGWDKANLSAPV